MRTIILNETPKAVSRPECHARGFIPFCLENSKLRIERRISLTADFLPFDNWTSQWHMRGLFQAIFPWIEAALELPTLGMSTHSFALVIDGTTPGASEAWKVLKYAAALQEAHLVHIQPNLIEQPPLSFIPHFETCWAFPDNFSKLIREITEGRLVVRFDGDAGEVWDFDVFLFERRNWTPDQWDEEWSDNIYSLDRIRKIFPQAAYPWCQTRTTTRRFVRIVESSSKNAQSGV